MLWGFPDGTVVKNLPASVGDVRDTVSISWLGRSWRRKWQPTPVFLPGKSHGQRSLVGYSPWGCKESEMTEQLSTSHTTSYGHVGPHTVSKAVQMQTKTALGDTGQVRLSFTRTGIWPSLK